jgi:serine/threonine protein kinase
MQKAKIINKKSINSVMNERLLLADLHHPFIVNMKSSFQDR